MVSASIQSVNELARPHFSPYSTAKNNFKRPNLRKLVSSGISDVAFISVSSEKTRMKKCWIMIIIMEKKSQEKTIIVGRQKLTSARPEK